jgi:hypothetical protein
LRLVLFRVQGWAGKRFTKEFCNEQEQVVDGGRSRRSSGALAQQDPPRTAPAEKMAPKAPAAAKAPAGDIHQNTVPSGGTVHNGEADINRKNCR